MKHFYLYWKRTLAVAVCIGMAACSTDLYDPEPDPAPNPNPDESLSGIPGDFDFLTVESKKMTVKVMDEYNGEKYYTIEVFDANPFNDASAKLLAGGKTNQNTPFVVDLVLEKTLEAVYIRQTDPKGYRSVVGVEVKDGDLYFDYEAALAEKVGNRSAALRGEPVYNPGDAWDYDAVFTAKLSQAQELAEGVRLQKGGIYKITKTYTGSIDFSEGGFTLYIAAGGKLILEKDRSYEVNGAEIYVLKGSSIEDNGNQSAALILSGGGLYNAGTVALKNIRLDAAQLYNHSNGKIYAGTLTLGGTYVYNNCLISADEFILEGDASTVCCNRVSSVVSKTFRVNSASPVLMYEKSLFETDNLTGSLNGRDLHANITGEAYEVGFEDLPLFKVNGTMVLNKGGGFDDTLTKNYVTFTGNVCYTAKKIISAGETSMFQLEYGKVPTRAEGDCYGVQYIPSDTTTPDSEDPEYNEQTGETPAYTYMFEDNWPSFGDYDMNDLVMDVAIANLGVVNNNAKSVVLTTTVRAVGAEKPLYAYARIEAPGLGELIVPLFDGEAHAFLGKTTKEKINTFNYNCESRTTVQTVEVRGIKGLVNALNLNVFLVWGDINAAKWNEVHLPSFKGTSRAAVSNTSTAEYRYNAKVEGGKPEFDNMMWALMVPTHKFVSYPKEATSIMKAYEGFTQWAKSGGKEVGDWYMNPTSADKIYQGKAPEK